MSTVKFYQRGDMKLIIPVTTKSPTTGKTTGTVPRTDFSLVEFDVYIGGNLVKQCSTDAADTDKLTAQAGDESHIFVLPLTASDHDGKYGLIDIQIRATKTDATYESGSYIIPSRVKGGEKMKNLNE